MGLKTRLGAGAIGLAVVALGLAILVLVLAGRLGDFNPVLRPGCEFKPAPDPTWPPPAAVVGGVIAFALGRGLAYARERRPPAPPPPRWTELLVQGVLVLFLGAVAGLLLYETVALADTSAHAPITWYVRCAASVWPLPAFGATAVVCFLLGHWLWYARR